MFIPKPKTAQDYIDRATACEQLADAAIAHETRETMLYLAGRWRALAVAAVRGKVSCSLCGIVAI